jgi:hypothetical protein
MNINLFINYYKCDDPIRQKEYDYCLKRNKKSGLFNEIITFDGRMAYNDFFEHAGKYPNDINVLANLDIYFNDTILLAKEIGDDEAYALTRWEIKGSKIIPFERKHDGARAMHSQDVWIIRGKARAVNGNFNMGVPGCDNRIAYELNRQYRVLNPSDKIKCIHKHKDEKRNYTLKYRVPPPYMWVPVGGEAILPSRQAHFIPRNPI